MRKIIMILVVLTLTTVLHAEENTREWGLYGGILNPTQDLFDSRFGSDFVIGVSHVRELSHNNSHEWSFQYYKTTGDVPYGYPDKRDSHPYGTRVDSWWDIQLFTLAWTFRHHQPVNNSFSVYVGAGFNGSYMCECEWAKYVMDDTGDVEKFHRGGEGFYLGIHAAVGTEFEIRDRNKLFAESRYVTNIPFGYTDLKPHFLQLVAGWRYGFRKKMD